MWWHYRLARGGGHSVIRSLGTAFFNLPLPDNSDEYIRELDEIIESATRRGDLENVRNAERIKAGFIRNREDRKKLLGE